MTNVVDILVPNLPESVIDATVVNWHKKPGDQVNYGEVLVEIETDKVILEIPAAENGTLDEILKNKGTTVISNQVLGRLRECKQTEKESTAKSEKKMLSITKKQQQTNPKEKNNNTRTSKIRSLSNASNFDPSTIKSAAVSDRLVNEDLDQNLVKAPYAEKIKKKAQSEKKATIENRPSVRNEKRVPMTRLRKRIAERLIEAKNSTAMLTTFNEVNMKPIIDLRRQYGKTFEKRHGIRLGFMSFYVKAVIEALKFYPEVNASIDGNDVVYYNYFDVSIAVSTPRGLVTPVLRNVDALSMADIEKTIKELTLRGNNGKLTVDDLTGGNFTITNGGVFGSLMSTPIINPPQSAILGMHVIKNRPMAVKDKIKILPIMYLALSYDHRLIDGRESVGFLLVIKKLLEDPMRLLLDV